jgi:hypothetical protein
MMLFLFLLLFQLPKPTPVPGEPPIDVQLSSQDASRTYYSVTVEGMKKTRWTHVVVEGRVVYSPYIAGDGDLHIRIEDEKTKARLSCEAIPSLPVYKPKTGEIIKVYGISRIDPYHKWPEIHPVEKIEVVSNPK